MLQEKKHPHPFQRTHRNESFSQFSSSPLCLETTAAGWHFHDFQIAGGLT